MAESGARALIEIRRLLSHDLRATYDAAWLDLRSHVEGAAGHAWRFALRDEPARFIEFLEFRANTDPRDEPAIAQALERLDQIANGTVEYFVDAPVSTAKGGG